jgi:hypothetical protein
MLVQDLPLANGFYDQLSVFLTLKIYLTADQHTWFVTQLHILLIIVTRRAWFDHDSLCGNMLLWNAPLLIALYCIGLTAVTLSAALTPPRRRSRAWTVLKYVAWPMMACPLVLVMLSGTLYTVDDMK